MIGGASAPLLTSLLYKLCSPNMNNALALQIETPTILSIHQRIARGKAIARLYIAAQHLSMVASNEACELIETANDIWQTFGFNQEMRKSPYATRAGSVHTQAEPFVSPEEQAAQVRSATIEPWMRPEVEVEIPLNGFFLVTR